MVEMLEHFEDLFTYIWRGIWLVPMLITFFLLALVIFIRNGEDDAATFMEIL